MSVRQDPWLPLKLVLMSVGTFTFAFFLMPPLYDAFCEITGVGGRTNEAPVALSEQQGESRTVTIQFTTSVNEYAPYAFEAEVTSMDVEIGKIYDANFIATNLTDMPRVAQAIPSVYPNKAGVHLKKTECFCFNNQPFEGLEAKEMPLRFMIDRDLPSYIDTITLDYTFFNIDATANNSL
ncbi:MAG: cytochrome c oxidase assembly protein [Woeseiaceae bacterium]